MQSLAKFFIVVGLIFILFGILFLIFPRISIFKLPGDILIKKDSFTFYFPVATSIIISLFLTLLLNLLLRR
ncbi:MAG: DUF2905 domain-containing protein [candidate division WOR-3 bacterium]